MADFGIYWKNFARERRQGDWPCTRWFTNSDPLGRAAPGDRLWLITSGERCGMAEGSLGYLVEVLVVRSVANNTESDSDYPPADYAFAVHGDPARCLVVDPPLLIDRLIRRASSNPELPIGTVHQGPWRLKGEVVATLLDQLQQERPNLYQTLCGGNS
jgi:hypothetical protein